MTISVPTSGGETFEAQLEEDEFHMLWRIHRNRRNRGRVQILLSAALQTGWRIVDATPAERALVAFRVTEFGQRIAWLRRRLLAG